MGVILNIPFADAINRYNINIFRKFWAEANSKMLHQQKTLPTFRNFPLNKATLWECQQDYKKRVTNDLFSWVLIFTVFPFAQKKIAKQLEKLRKHNQKSSAILLPWNSMNMKWGKSTEKLHTNKSLGRNQYIWFTYLRNITLNPCMQ